MDFAEHEDHRAIRAAVRDVCKQFDDDYWMRLDAEHTFPWEFYREMAKGGWIGIAIPEAYGGGGQGITEASLVLEEVAASGACMNGASAIHLSIFGMHPVVLHGSEELKQRVLPPVASGELHVAFGVTEPDAGLDTTSISTRAVRDNSGDSPGYRIHGRKVWTSKALESDKVLLLTRTTPKAECAKPTEGMTLFVADLKDPAVHITAIPKLGRNAVASCEVVYDGLRVADRDRVGEEGKGFRYLLDGLNAERVLVASEALGIGRAAVRRAVAYAKERVVFGRPIGQNQGISFPLAESHARLRAAELAIREASWRVDQRLPSGEQANTAKFLAADAAFKAADAAVQTHGGFGYASEYHVERYFREARLQKLAPVPQEMVLNYIAEHVLGLPKSY
ncbi:MAG: acyl-CoA dehydrogenase [Pseudonocardiales bacterium]|nr:Butyryl-CoA dehydrogenase [Pseudonocardia sp.]MDT7589379.1 acyl-CoA dehydrogenase [Pseudonocardiales bacterium]MDT7591626.1 acyl-CoA dehydrogenase [Pseudonocardiales bacterium]MDT7625379.1 acyl-CoA dehydrogenase [Pseudonocardiales bacterium]MDT7634537.1 acyl-CoA dehydrogenase [Pseudonocardiales bacterium]